MDQQGRKKKILLIDDEVSLCTFTKRNLERQGEGTSLSDDPDYVEEEDQTAHSCER